MGKVGPRSSSFMIRYGDRSRRSNMVENEFDPIDRAFAEGIPIDEGIEEGVQQALRRHKRAGNPIVVWQDGKMQWIAAEEIEIQDEGE
jgi:hypothetical protein